MAAIFDQPKKEQFTVQHFLTDQLITQEDQSLNNEAKLLGKVNKDQDQATDETVMLAHHIGETRKLLIALREQLALSEYWRTKVYEDTN
jgi:hypothetical protein